jgi:hypothetical protein
MVCMGLHPTSRTSRKHISLGFRCQCRAKGTLWEG